MTGTDSRENAIRDALAKVAGDRLASVRITDDAATVVLEVGGLDAAARDRLEIAVRGAWRETGHAAPLRVAQMAERDGSAPAAPKAPRIVAVGSGKGGVGKSTVSANLAIALKRAGVKVGLVDADIYGPSQPRLMDSEAGKPQARDKKLVPVDTRFGVPMLSMGHLAEPGQAIAWRGPMAGNALAQLIDAHWGDVDTLVVDLPPGTGDVQLTMIQRFKPDGAVIVSTPQDLALMDAARAVALFDKAGVPVIGVVENMAGYLCPHCGEASDPFGHGGAEASARAMGHAFLGRIPLAIDIRKASDAGEPPAAGEGPVAETFAAIATGVAAALQGSGGKATVPA
ncbi:Mrp/NBP35 family ATP-binding protein [Croceicoccus sp. BE223]|uniref:Mrp/NBP35 family ATP-binding protein n=1 Tax=Croceicoccus sp. BE223 TaxID=2817716 RepID=UPI00285C02F5|nr:Mrp/NBP35 family ATP-binding protein [Croceicoccus sp. BE223]MDR7100939.1 ATP-binding protein involved in chromosome partitioning [Croceicoccus sp. BE223]